MDKNQILWHYCDSLKFRSTNVTNTSRATGILRKKQEALDAGLEGMRDRVRMGLRRGSFSQDKSYRKRETFRSNMTLLAVVILLLIATYVFLTRYLPKFLQLIEARQEL